MDAKEFLTRNVLLNEDINIDFLRLQELKRMRAQLGGLAPKERVQGGKLHESLVEKIAGQITDLERDIDVELAEYNAIQEEIKKAISYCKDYDEIRILKKRYLEKKEWADIAREVGFSERKVYDVHRAALLKIEEYLCSNLQ